VRDLEKILDDALGGMLPALIDRERGHLYRVLVTQLDRTLFAAVLTAARGNRLEAARILGINRNTLRKRLQALGLGEPKTTAARRG
jgi:two-component system nitrogen regulation response regulator GlnG